MKLMSIIVLFGTVFPGLAETRNLPDSDQPSVIVGGEDVGREFEFVVNVGVVERDRSLTECTGALIHESWVLTAGHCLESDSTPEDVSIILLASRWNVTDWESQFREASHLEIRPGYDTDGPDENVPWGQVELDQALIRLEDPARDVSPVAVTGFDDTPISFAAYSTTTQQFAVAGALAGWGWSRWGKDMSPSSWESPDVLQWVPVYVAEAYWARGVLVARNPTRKRTGHLSKYTAPGDSGCPILLWTIEGWTLVGVNSGGIDDNSRFAGGYGGGTTWRLMRWIKNTMREYGDTLDSP